MTTHRTEPRPVTRTFLAEVDRYLREVALEAAALARRGELDEACFYLELAEGLRSRLATAEGRLQ